MPQSEPPRPCAATGLQCLHEDAHLLVLDKPSGLLCVPGRGPDKQDCLSRRAQQQWADALVVHRLDQATSGLVLMARNPEAQRRLPALPSCARCTNATSPWWLAPWRSPGWCISTIDLPIAADWERRLLRTIDPHRGVSQTR
jgi:tRNA pseudouridine32 synthase/23S rRNA pseudouridine746 synthase